MEYSGASRYSENPAKTGQEILNVTYPMQIMSLWVRSQPKVEFVHTRVAYLARNGSKRENVHNRWKDGENQLFRMLSSRLCTIEASIIGENRSYQFSQIETGDIRVEATRGLLASKMNLKLEFGPEMSSQSYCRLWIHHNTSARPRWLFKRTITNIFYVAMC